MTKVNSILIIEERFGVSSTDQKTLTLSSDRILAACRKHGKEAVIHAARLRALGDRSALIEVGLPDCNNLKAALKVSIIAHAFSDGD